MTPEEIKSHRLLVQQSFKAAGHETLHLLKFCSEHSGENIHGDTVRVIAHSRDRAQAAIMVLNAAFLAADAELKRKGILRS